MDFSEEWKSLWPISSVFLPPLLLSDSAGGGGGGAGDWSSNSRETIGPLVFNPCPMTLTRLFSSPSLSPPLPPPFPNLSLPRFLHTASSSSILPSISSSIVSQFGPQLPDPLLLYNRLQLLRCPGTPSVLAFFPTGDNCDRVGFVLLKAKDAHLDVCVDGVSDGIFMAKNKLNHQIVRLLVNPVADFDPYPSSSGNYCFTTIGFLLVCTMYSVNYYRIRVRRIGSDSEKSELDFLGGKLFKSCAIVHACWSPHLPEESVVLLESGDMYLFDLDSCAKNQILRTNFVGKKLRIWYADTAALEKGKWLSCEISWHPRILIVAHSTAVFLVDLRSESCNISCLLKIETMVMGNSNENDRFVALCRAGPDGFYFSVASNRLLLLCDVRKPLMPVLQWAHNLDNPYYVSVFKLSELRSHSKDDKYKWASESGYCILLGSFWNCEYSIFCYGPDAKRSVASEISRFCHSFYAWELPSELSLSARDCHCGNCLVRGEFLKDALPQWIDWRQKKEIVLGFGILDIDLSAHLFDPDSFGGFTLIRLMSSGRLESQRYCASWEFMKISEKAHKEPSRCFEASLLYNIVGEEYKFRKRFYFLKLELLKWHMQDNLGKLLLMKMKKLCEVSHEENSSDLDFHEQICQKLKACGLRTLKPSYSVDDVLPDISLPTSILETALQNAWVGLPLHLLSLAFSTYSEFLGVLVNQKKVSLEFLEIPDPQLHSLCYRRPSRRSRKWTHNVPPNNDFVGPVVALPFLVTLHEFLKEGDRFSADLKLKHQCNKVMEVAGNVATSDSVSEPHHDYAVSLADDGHDIFYDPQKAKAYSLHEPTAFSDKSFTSFSTSENSAFDSKIYTTFIFKTRKNDDVPNAGQIAGPEMFDSMCPVELKFNGGPKNFGPKELTYYKILNRQCSEFQKGFHS